MQMDAKQLIDKLLSDESIYGVSVFNSKVDWKIQFTEYIKKIHHDVCKLPGAEAAERKLLHYKDIYQFGKMF